MRTSLTSTVSVPPSPDERAAPVPAGVPQGSELGGARAGALDGHLGAVTEEVAELVVGLHCDVHRTHPAGQRPALGRGISAHHPRRAHGRGEHPGREPDRTEPGDEHLLAARERDAAQRLVGGGEAAGHARAVEEGQRVGQRQEIALAGQQLLGVPAVALPAVGLTARRRAADLVAAAASSHCPQPLMW